VHIERRDGAPLAADGARLSQAVEKRRQGSRCKAKTAKKRSLCAVNEHFEAVSTQ
jgi:hypothetical protein